MIDLDALPHLTDAMLKEMGLPIGPRAKVLGAILALESVGTAATSAEPAKLTQSDQSARPLEAERRQITVMFCDLVGSTALSEKLDPEDLRTLMEEYQRAAGAVIERYEGHVAQYLGDGLMTYFGWPQAHEDDAERAVRAGLEVVDAVKKISSPEPLQVRIGIATGPVVVGETGAGDASVPKLAVGETPNIAARVQGLADSDEIVIADTTHRLTRGAFDYTDMGKRDLKGIIEPVRAWRIEGMAKAEGRFQAHGGGVTPFVGRDAEVAMIFERWQRAKAGEGQVVLLCGEPGIGKSRITQVLRERVAEEPHTRLRYQCSPYHTNSALYPVIEQVARAAGFARDETAVQKFEKLEGLLAESAQDLQKTAGLFSSMLSLDAGGRYPAINVSPQKKKDLTVQALADQVAGLAKKRPVLMIFEDAHWIDPTTQEVMDLIVPAVAGQAVLVVITHRPEYEPPWSGFSHATPLTLKRLGQANAAVMAERVTGGRSLPDEVLDQIVAKTDGVPLFVEELTKTVLEAEFLVDTGDRYVLDGPLPPLAIPSTLQDSLMARLDKLAPIKEIAQIGACIGRDFSYERLAAVSPIPNDELLDSLQQLVSSELIFRRGVPPEASFTFKHALVLDAAYGSLLKSRRHEIHLKLATAIKNNFPEIAANEPELLAHHYTEAGLAKSAIGYWLAAGKRAADRSSYVEALSHLRAGLAQLPELADSAESNELELDLQIAQGVALLASKGFAALETTAAYERARILCAELDDPPQIFQTFYGLWACYVTTKTMAFACNLADEFLGKAEQSGERVAMLVANRLLGYSYEGLGEFKLALKHAGQALELYDPTLDHQLMETYSVDPRAIALRVRSLALWSLGYPDQARCTMQKALDWAEETQHAYTLAYFLSISWVDYCLLEPGDVQERANRCLLLCEERGFGPEISSIARFTKGWALAHGGDLDTGLAEVRKGFDEYQATGAHTHRILALKMLTETLAVAGKTNEAKEAMGQTLREMVERPMPAFEADCHRISGELSLLNSDDGEAEAEAAYRRAIEIARSQEAKSFELRAATSLARLWLTRGESKMAYGLLAPVHGWFTEGFETADLKAASALLQELEAA